MFKSADEFQCPRERIEAHPTMLDYCKSRDTVGLARLIWDETHQRNVFASYKGTSAEHSRVILEAAAFDAK